MADSALKSDVNTPSSNWAQMEQVRALPSDLMVGTLAVHEQSMASNGGSGSYLPKEYGEDEDAWKARIYRSVVVGIFKESVGSIVGRVFETVGVVR